MAFIPDSQTPQQSSQKNTPLFTGKEPEMLKNTLVGLIPGGNYGSKLIGQEWERMFTPPQQRKEDTFFQDLMKLPMAVGNDVVERVKRFPGFVTSAVATPALSVSEAVGGPSQVDLGPLGQQSSYQKQREGLKKQGAGEVYSDTMPVVQWLLSVLAGKKMVGAGKNIAKNVSQKIENQQNINLATKYLRPPEKEALALFKKGKSFKEVASKTNSDAAAQANRIMKGGGEEVKMLIDRMVQNKDMALMKQLEGMFAKAKKGSIYEQYKPAFEYSKNNLIKTGGLESGESIDQGDQIDAGDDVALGDNPLDISSHKSYFDIAQKAVSQNLDKFNSLVKKVGESEAMKTVIMNYAKNQGFDSIKGDGQLFDSMLLSQKLGAKPVQAQEAGQNKYSYSGNDGKGVSSVSSSPMYLKPGFDTDWTDDPKYAYGPKPHPDAYYDPRAKVWRFPSTSGQTPTNLPSIPASAPPKPSPNAYFDLQDNTWKLPTTSPTGELIYPERETVVIPPSTPPTQPSAPISSPETNPTIPSDIPLINPDNVYYNDPDLYPTPQLNNPQNATKPPEEYGISPEQVNPAGVNTSMNQLFPDLSTANASQPLKYPFDLGGGTHFVYGDDGTGQPLYYFTFLTDEKKNVYEFDSRTRNIYTNGAMWQWNPQTKQYTLLINPYIGLPEYDAETRTFASKEYTNPSEVNLSPQTLEFNSFGEIYPEYVDAVNNYGN